MALEAAGWISELDATNPVSTDKKKQGDDHIRMLKTVLKAVFPNASKAFRFPTVSSSQTASFSVVAADQNKLFLISTASVAVTATLPTLVSGDAGWECFFIKTNTGLLPYFVQPPSGTIQSGDLSGLAKTRRSIPGAKTRVFWTGSVWIAERVVGVPVGTILDIPRAGLPVGYEYADGVTLTDAASSYPDFVSAIGSGAKADRRGCAAFGMDNFGTGAAGRLTTTTFADPNLVGQIGGNQLTTLGQSNLPNVAFSGSMIGNTSGTMSGTMSGSTTGQLNVSGTADGTIPGGQFKVAFVPILIGSGTGFPLNALTTPSYPASALPNSGAFSASVTGETTGSLAADVSGSVSGSLSVSVSGSVSSGGNGNSFSNVPPGVITRFMQVVE